LKLFIYISILTSLFGCTTLLRNSQKISTKHGEFSYQLSGNSNGNPTIILETGAGDDMSEWKSTLGRFEEYSRVFAYNRAGFSGSDSQNKQRNAQTIAIELRELLKEANVPPPYILVGHSLGGLYLRVFANTFPDEIAAVIQIDSTHHEMIKDCKDSEGNFYRNPTGIPKWAFLILPDAMVEESKELCESLDIASDNASFPKVPLVVLTSGNVQNDIEKTSQEWEAIESQQKYLATISPISKHIICASCGHYVHQDKPELITEALDWIFDKM
jgi:pimeloyl-ACP methyl ester carboxylesterase